MAMLRIRFTDNGPNTNTVVKKCLTLDIWPFCRETVIKLSLQKVLRCEIIISASQTSDLDVNY